MFINRKKELEWLMQIAVALELKRGINGSILGLRRIGKTELILEFKKNFKLKNIIIPYFNLQSSISSPKRFCLDFIYILLIEVCTYKKINLPKSQGIEKDIPIIAALIDNTLFEKIILILNLLDKNIFEESLRSIFKLPEELSLIIKTKILFLLDEFQEIDDLKLFNLDVFAIMRTVIEKQETVKYIVTGSIISFMEELFTNPNKPFFNQFNIKNLSYFNKKDTKLFIKHLLDYDFISIENSAFATLFTLTNGHPFYIKSTCERIFFECRFNDYTVDSRIINYAFLKEVLDKEGKLNILFDYIYNYSLEKVQRKGSLKSPLLVLAENEGLNLTGIAKKLNKPTGQISNSMKSLIKTDLIIKEDNQYYFRDPVFRFWLAKTSLGIDLSIKFNNNLIDSYINDLKEQYLIASTQLGRMKEFELYYFINENQGKIIGNVKIPIFKKIIKNYITPDGSELDLFAINNKSWAFELKWKNKLTGKKEIQKFLKKIKAGKYIFISKGGYTKEAIKFSNKNGIILWDEDIIK